MNLNGNEIVVWKKKVCKWVFKSFTLMIHEQQEKFISLNSQVCGKL